MRRLQKKAAGILLGIGILGFICNLGHMTDVSETWMMPRSSYAGTVGEGSSQFWEKQMGFVMPLIRYRSQKEAGELQTEDVFTSKLIAAKPIDSGDNTDTGLAERVDGEKVKASLTIEKLRDVSYLLGRFYTVDSTTTVKKSQMNVDKFLKKDMHLDQSTKGPKVLIFHTHSQEAFKDSKKGDKTTTIVGIGAYLAEKLNEKGIETLHHAGVYDFVNGKLDRSKAYELSEKGVKEILNRNPSIEVVIDLHRDGVKNNVHLVKEVDGKPTARIMFFNGLSRTKTNGDISYLYNPYIEDNLAFSFQMQLASETLYPGFARKIYLKGYRYSLHMMPKSLLIEAGAQTNTVEEMKNAMDLLSNILYDVLVK